MATEPIKPLSQHDMLKEISPIGGYADGDYVCLCSDCSRQFTGDKRAQRCLPCVVRGLVHLGELLETGKSK